MSALDAVEAAVKILEEDPTFDAGRGAFLNALGEIELDAMISGAASATGWGESIMKVLLSKYVCDILLNQNAIDAAKSAIEMLQQRVDGLGGLILIDKQGQYGYAHNTSKMAFAFAESPDIVIAKIKI
jgi:isoaspartyl peptidase/L-asparaginase-like protein (Ntn-hydrolase superfamily)